MRECGRKECGNSVGWGVWECSCEGVWEQGVWEQCGVGSVGMRNNHIKQRSDMLAINAVRHFHSNTEIPTNVTHWPC